MEQSKILILSSESEIMGPWFRRLRPLARLHHHLPLGFHQIWYGNWSSRVRDYDAIIVFENYWVKELLQYIRSRNARCRLIVYYNNPMNDAPGCSSPQSLCHLPCELYSFDKGDCEAFGMKYNPWCLPRIYPVKSLPAMYDAFFIGSDKGRLQSLIELKNALDHCGFKTRFIIVKDKRKKYAPSELAYLSNARVPYQEVVDIIQQSRCLVEILQRGQCGISERSMEALVYRKKLITNNKDIANYDFYRKENIFVLGKDPIEQMRKFMDSPLAPIDESIVNRYTYQSWLGRFFEAQGQCP